MVERDTGRISQMLNDSAKAVRHAVKSRVEAGRDMNLHYDHPIPAPAHALARGVPSRSDKACPQGIVPPMTDEAAGQITWVVWMRKE